MFYNKIINQTSFSRKLTNNNERDVESVKRKQEESDEVQLKSLKRTKSMSERNKKETWE